VPFWIERVVAFVKLGRPKFLLGGSAFYGLGAALATIGHGPIEWHAFAWGQAIVTSTQLMTHYSNDYFDLAADRANRTPTRWSGGSRILPSGLLQPRVALFAALVFACISACLVSLLAVRPDSPRALVPLVILLIGLAWSYSAPPLRLLARGLGELTTALVVTLLTPLLGFYLQCGVFERLPFLACVPLAGLQLAMLLTIELPDAAGDALTGKRTLVVRWGAKWSGRLGAALLAAAFCALPLLWWGGLPWTVAASAGPLAPFAAWQAARLWRAELIVAPRWESLATASVALLFLTAVAELSGTLIASASNTH